MAENYRRARGTTKSTAPESAASKWWRGVQERKAEGRAKLESEYAAKQERMKQRESALAANPSAPRTRAGAYASRPNPGSPTDAQARLAAAKAKAPAPAKAPAKAPAPPPMLARRPTAPGANTAAGKAVAKGVADTAAKVKAKAAPSSKSVKTVHTKGGDYPVYKKDSAEAQSFRGAFADARKAGKKTFTWQGRSYTTEVKK